MYGQHKRHDHSSPQVPTGIAKMDVVALLLSRWSKQLHLRKQTVPGGHTSHLCSEETNAPTLSCCCDECGHLKTAIPGVRHRRRSDNVNRQRCHYFIMSTILSSNAFEDAHSTRPEVMSNVPPSWSDITPPASVNTTSAAAKSLPAHVSAVSITGQIAEQTRASVRFWTCGLRSKRRLAHMPHCTCSEPLHDQE